MDLVGKTIERVAERHMAARDTYKDFVTWTETVLHFTDGTECTFDRTDTEVYNPFEYSDVDDSGDPIPLVDHEAKNPPEAWRCLAQGEHLISTRHRRDECPTT